MLPNGKKDHSMALKDDLTKVAKQVAKEAEHVVGKAVKQAGELTDANRHKIGDALDKAGKFVDDKTDGKFSKQIDQAKGLADKGVDFVAKQKAHLPGRPGHHQDDAEPAGPAADWKDTSPQDEMTAEGAPPPVSETSYPNPIPPYTPPNS